MIGYAHYLIISAILFAIALFGIFYNRRSVIVILASLEIALLAASLNFIAFSTALDDIDGQIFSLMILTVAAAEAAVGLAVLTVYYRNRGSVDIDDAGVMKG